MKSSFAAAGVLLSIISFHPGTSLACGSAKPEEKSGAQPALTAKMLESPQSLETFDSLGMLVNSVIQSELMQRDAILFHGQQLSNIVPSGSLVRSTMQGALLGGLTSALSENPKLFGGNPNRGYRPKIWKAMVRAYMSRTIMMTSDGVLLDGPQGLEIRMDPSRAQATRNGNYSGADLYLCNENGSLIGPSMKPIQLPGYQMAEEDGIDPLGSQWTDMVHYGNLQSMMKGASVTLTTARADLSLPALNDGDDEETRTLSECFNMAASEKWKEAAECFKSVGWVRLGEGALLGKDLTITGARGAAVGAVVGSIVPGWGTASGAVLGAASNMMSVMYNAFLKKEKITQKQIQNLMDVFALYGYAPTAYGQLLPRPGTRWLVSGNTARLVTAIDGKLVQADVLGRPIMKPQSVRLSGAATQAIGTGVSTNAPASVTPAPGKAAVSGNAAPQKVVVKR
jgi:hypothetical protein